MLEMGKAGWGFDTPEECGADSLGIAIPGSFSARNGIFS
jgi:hypothetical protein